jgi:uncharacterized protein (DUF362 family)
VGKRIVAIVRFEKPLASVRNAVNLSHGLDHLPNKANVFIKPNIVFWTRTTPFPKWGVVTTSRVVEDMVILLKERGIEEITILEGIATYDPRDPETHAHAFESLGYNILKSRYGVKVLNVFERPFKTWVRALCSTSMKIFSRVTSWSTFLFSKHTPKPLSVLE